MDEYNACHFDSGSLNFSLNHSQCVGPYSDLIKKDT